MADPQRPRGSARPRRVDDVRGLGRGPDVGVLGGEVRLRASGPLRARGVALYARSAAGGVEVLTRQLASARTVLPAGAVVVGVFADLCAWDGWPPDPATITTTSDDPSICTGWTLGDHTVDGGMLTMLRRAHRPVPAFDLVVCADFERLSRKAWRQILIEDTFRACGVAVASADEGPPALGGNPPLSAVLGLDSPSVHNGAG